MVDLNALPGSEWVEAGLIDLHRGHESPAAALVSIAASRLRDAGLPVPPREQLISEPEFALYRMLEASDSDGAHSRYNALLRRLDSFTRALECVSPSTAHASSP